MEFISDFQETVQNTLFSYNFETLYCIDLNTFDRQVLKTIQLDTKAHSNRTI